MTLQDLINKCTGETKIKLIIDDGGYEETIRHFDSVDDFIGTVSFGIYKDWTVNFVKSEHDYLVIVI